MRIVHVVIFRKEFRPISDTLNAEVRTAIPFQSKCFDKTVDGILNSFIVRLFESCSLFVLILA